MCPQRCARKAKTGQVDKALAMSIKVQPQAFWRWVIISLYMREGVAVDEVSSPSVMNDQDASTKIMTTGAK